MWLEMPLSHIYHCPAPIAPDQLIYATLLSLLRRLGDKTLRYSRPLTQVNCSCISFSQISQTTSDCVVRSVGLQKGQDLGSSYQAKLIKGIHSFICWAKALIL